MQDQRTERASTREYVVPVTIADERLVTVVASNEAEAKAKVHAGRYKALGRSLNRGWLLVGTPAEKTGAGA